MSPGPNPLASFAARFNGLRPQFLARAPGRVNLIGEHVDYNDLPVLPMALQRATTLVGRRRDDSRIRIANVDAAYPPREFEASSRIEPAAQGDWSNYVRAAVQALASEHGATRGFDALIAGDVPPAAGLSSSSALVVASGLAAAFANDVAVEPLPFAESMARAERYVGTNSGGMDQAISIAGRAGHAVRIDFAPLRAEPIPCPARWRFVIAHSLVHADKSGAARESYNQRRRDCEEALAFVSRLAEFRDAPSTYRGLIDRFGSARLLDAATSRLRGTRLARFRHPITEYERVVQACAALRSIDSDSFGAAMNASHASLAGDFEVSCAELDALVDAARAAGARGARLTGAGFGGCIVALAYEDEVDALVQGLRDSFYARRAAPTFEPILVAAPSDGARVEALA